MYDWLFDSLFESCVDQIADGRKVTREKARGWIDEGLFSTDRAAEAGVIDAVEYRAQFVQHIEQEHGEKTKFDKRYGKSDRQTIDFSNPFAVFKIWGEILSGGSTKKSTKDAVGIVYVEGPIMPGESQPSPFMGAQQIAYSTPIRKALDKVADDDSIKAVVLRVNSPGGSVVASEIILQATKRIAEKKPLVVSMGNVAGSGGYYVACGANTIFADGTTITGSIGVVAGKLATREMWDKVGIGWHPISRGKNSGMLSSGDVFTDEQREKLQSWMDEVYADFQGHVTSIRGDRLQKPIDEIAGGRVYTGRQALELGLVDRLGTLSDAIQFAAKEAQLEKYDVRIEPKPKSFIEVLLEESAGGGDSDQQIHFPSIAAQWQTANLWKNVAPLLGNLEPQRLNALQRAFIQLEILQREGVTLAMPEFLSAEK
jgi:protease-4